MPSKRSEQKIKMRILFEFAKRAQIFDLGFFPHLLFYTICCCSVHSIVFAFVLDFAIVNKKKRAHTHTRNTNISSINRNPDTVVYLLRAIVMQAHDVLKTVSNTGNMHISLYRWIFFSLYLDKYGVSIRIDLNLICYAIFQR